MHDFACRRVQPGHRRRLSAVERNAVDDAPMIGDDAVFWTPRADAPDFDAGQRAHDSGAEINRLGLNSAAVSAKAIV